MQKCGNSVQGLIVDWLPPVGSVIIECILLSLLSDSQPTIVTREETPLELYLLLSIRSIQNALRLSRVPFAIFAIG